MPIELGKGVYWVGIVDWDIRRFHGHEYSTHRGTTYNAYLITDDKNVLVDTVAEPFSADLLTNISQIIDPSKLDYVVANHSEADHSGALPAVMRDAPNAELVVSKRGAESFQGHYHHTWKTRTVKTGERIPIGRHELIFVEAPMLHWPDSMFTYLTGHNILMPNDAFGQHYASAYRFNDLVDAGELYEEALKYYVNILTPFSPLVAKKIEEVLALGLPVDILAPSHGIIWRKEPLQIVKKYQEWAQQKPEARAVLLYDTMWNATRKMAAAIGEGLSEAGIENKLLRAAVTDRNDALVEVFRSKAVIIGSPTLNNGVLPTLTPLLEDLKGLKFKNKIGAAFGSYGWSGESVKQIEGRLGEAGIPLVKEGIRCKWQPGPDDIESCRRLGRDVAEAIKKV